MPGHVSPQKFLALVVSVLLSGSALAGTLKVPSEKSTKGSISSLVERALAENADSANAVAELRALGPSGLKAFLDANRDAINSAIKSRAGTTGGELTDTTNSLQRNRVLSALDSICQQKDCHASRLFWYTDLEQAKSAARAQGKAILSLRLLGRLDEDLSCANSRLFRITLYANNEISSLLREQYVLHWESVRPVPKLSIDFGDGRRMERTLTGNSIHYALDPDGLVIDALPGLYGPGAFLRELQRISLAAATLRSLKSGPERNAALRQYHKTRADEIEQAWLSDVKRAGLVVAPSRELPKPLGTPRAETATRVGITKAVMIERPILRGLSDRPSGLDSIASDAGWSRIARLHVQDTTLDESTLALMSFKDPAMNRGSRQLATLALGNTTAEDTVRNEYVFRPVILKWLASGFGVSDAGSMNEKIYAELFLTPGWDAWLGLRPDAAYSGIDDDGLKR